MSTGVAKWCGNRTSQKHTWDPWSQRSSASAGQCWRSFQLGRRSSSRSRTYWMTTADLE